MSANMSANTPKWAMIIDVAACHNCRNCFITCKDEHTGNDFPGYAAPQPLHGHEWISIATRERGAAPMLDVVHLVTLCNQCEAAPCVDKSQGAVHRRPDGIVIIDPVKAKGRRDIVATCPYGAIWWNEDAELPQKYIFDAHLLDTGWKEPRAVQSCPTAAMRAVKLDDEALAALVAEEKLQVLQPELGTKPRVFYKNLDRYTKFFVGGTITAQAGDVVDCVAGASVALSHQGKVVGQATSDDFGEFKIDGLPAEAASYQIEISKPGYQPLSVEAQVTDSLYIGTVMLAAA